MDYRYRSLMESLWRPPNSPGSCTNTHEALCDGADVTRLVLEASRAQLAPAAGLVFQVVKPSAPLASPSSKSLTLLLPRI